jgi:hypothetical protein
MDFGRRRPAEERIALFAFDKVGLSTSANGQIATNQASEELMRGRELVHNIYTGATLMDVSIIGETGIEPEMRVGRRPNSSRTIHIE